jgi:hypothetical protein
VTTDHRAGRPENESEPRAERRGSDSRARPRLRGRDRTLKQINDRFGVVFVLLIATFTVLACGLRTEWLFPITVALQGATLLAVLAAARVSQRWQNIARVTVCMCVLTAFAAVPGYGAAGKTAAAILSAALVAVCPVVIARSIMRRHVIDVSTVLGALCIYVLAGLFFAFLYSTMGQHTDHFFAQIQDGRSSDYVYFSFVTLTTTGYGDLTAAQSVGRAFAVQEALIGQVYLVTVVAVLVSNLAPTRRRAAMAEADEAAASDPPPDEA